MIRLLVKEIALMPDDGALQIDARGDLAGILAISLGRKKAVTGAVSTHAQTVSGRSSKTQKAALLGRLMARLRIALGLVAGAGFEPATFRL